MVAGQPHGPAAVITRRAADRLRAGHLWVYRSDVETLVPPVGTEGLAPGTLVTVADGRGIPLGTAIYSAASQIMLRVVSAEAGLAREAYLRLVRDIGDWWNPAHTFSGNAHNISIDEKPMGCFCEKLARQGGVRHMEVA